MILSRHIDETFLVDTEDEELTLQLEKARRRFGGPEPQTRYRFAVVDRRPLSQEPSIQ